MSSFQDSEFFVPNNPEEEVRACRVELQDRERA